jgi:hypothetical protein
MSQQYKVVDKRNCIRNNESYEIRKDNEQIFSFRDKETGVLTVLNSKHFQEERIIDEEEALVLAIKGIQLEKVKSNSGEKEHV